jgi:hypothetical protein
LSHLGRAKLNTLTFVNDKDFSPTPPGASFPILLDLFNESVDILYAEADSSERMDRHAADVTSSDAYIKP